MITPAVLAVCGWKSDVSDKEITTAVLFFSGIAVLYLLLTIVQRAYRWLTNTCSNCKKHAVVVIDERIRNKRRRPSGYAYET